LKVTEWWTRLLAVMDMSFCYAGGHGLGLGLAACLLAWWHSWIRWWVFGLSSSFLLIVRLNLYHPFCLQSCLFGLMHDLHDDKRDAVGHHVVWEGEKKGG
jgi:hypothetical protein